MKAKDLFELTILQKKGDYSQVSDDQETYWVKTASLEDEVGIEDTYQVYSDWCSESIIRELGE